MGGGMSDLRVTYNTLVQKIVASRSAHAARLQEVKEAQDTEAEGLRRERDALVAALSEVEATFEASVKTLETQLLLLLRSKLEVEFKGEVEAQELEMDELSVRRDEQNVALAELRAEYDALVTTLEEQQTVHAAHVAAAAREALVERKVQADEELARLKAAQEAERAAVEDELRELRAQAHKMDVDHGRLVESLRLRYREEIEEARRKHEAVLSTEKARRSAEADDQLAAMRRGRETEITDLERQLEATRARCAAAADAIISLRDELATVVNDAPRARADLEARHRADMAQLDADRARADSDRAARERADLDGAVSRAIADEKAKAAAELEQARRGDPELAGIQADIDRLKARIKAADAKAGAERAARDRTLKTLADTHDAGMADVLMQADEADAKVKSSHSISGDSDEDGDPVADALAMANDRARELVAADKAAAIDQLQADCAAYADALAALQRALAAERNAHGAQVRRLQAELDSKESELALLNAEEADAQHVGSTPKSTNSSSPRSPLATRRGGRGNDATRGGPRGYPSTMDASAGSSGSSPSRTSGRSPPTTQHSGSDGVIEEKNDATGYGHSRASRGVTTETEVSHGYVKTTRHAKTKVDAVAVAGAAARSAEISRFGLGLLSATKVDGDDPVAAEWRRLVAEEKLKLTARTMKSPKSKRRAETKDLDEVRHQLAIVNQQLQERTLDPGILAKLTDRKAALQAALADDDEESPM